ncbi:transmembrane protein 222 isoform X2 [Bemisia tabaci]|uniref:transmembrane protein 222 isoform X2 n=1 Tax=Bemisia tabaci TaxID=7038 RepID=UPI0008F9A7BE|nr:PREDICTED: transmembrane protein 222 [Bemisia tabaci]
MKKKNIMGTTVDTENHRYPFCVVWTPLPVFSWLFPFIGHMGICNSAGIIRDFAGPYRVSEDNMAFGNPTRYWQLNPTKVAGGAAKWDQAVRESSDIYSSRMHTICDNCHSHVATALCLMEYNKQNNWNMFKVGIFILWHGKSVGAAGFLKTYLPATVIYSICLVIVVQQWL